eukprot:TRINITY_DN5913_c1_g1_i1.p1 TRINITY_DN5913_c1_g1~~TRINITY_DN5913_c1_g1_i1.p1  ORF type:complete len:211 (-),score=25.19 TRINITY_DN5913_c1_g1_i1:87-719(-)
MMGHMVTKEEKEVEEDNSGGDAVINLLMVGKYGCGRSSFILRYARSRFLEKGKRVDRDTLGRITSVPFTDKTCVDDGASHTITLQMSDSAGRERSSRVRAHAIKRSHGLFLCFDITEKQSLEGLIMLQSLHEKHIIPGTQLLVLGCKKDLAQQRVVSVDDMHALARSWGATYVEVSALTGEGVSEAVEALAMNVIYNNLTIWQKKKKNEG